MNVLVSGSTGFIGSAMVAALKNQDHHVIRLVRAPQSLPEPEVLWDPQEGTIDTDRLQGIDAVVHLAGENIAALRWTQQKKARIRDSRIRGTALVCKAVSQMETPPKTLLCASAIGYYGDRADELLHEQSSLGSGFLPDMCGEWEAQTQPAVDKGIRVVHLRFGLVLSPLGGALKSMLLQFKLGLGGIIGSGRQYVSWISLDDATNAMNHVLATGTVHGPVNVVAPHPVTNREFTKTLANVLARPALFPIPAFLARLFLGEMADALLLASSHVEPRCLLESGYTFKHPRLEDALRHSLERRSIAREKTT